mgnify:CR=1 FL=1
MEILDGSPRQKLSRYVEWLITAVVLINCSAVILDSVPEIHADHKEFFHELEFWSVMFFTVEYVLRVWTLGTKYLESHGSSWKGRAEYIFSPFGLIDFFATVPHYIHAFIPGLDLRILRVLRLLRILKLSKYNTALQDLFHAVYSERQAFGSAVFLLTIATVVSADPEIDAIGAFNIGNRPPGTPGANPVPEPSTLFLLGSGLAGLAAWRRVRT